MTATVTTPTDREIHIERIFNAPRAKVWRAFTEPELLAQWWGRGNERDGMLQAGMEGGLNQSYAALDRLLETPS